MGTTSAPAVLTVELRCGACGGTVGARAVVPPPPAFSSLSWEVQTLLLPVLKFAARKSPALAELVARWRSADDTQASVAGALALMLPRVIRCARCADDADPVFAREWEAL